MLSRQALAQYGIEHARIRPIVYAENATFDVSTGEGRYVLRVNRPHVHAVDAVQSEMAWLQSLRHDTDLRVPQPVATHDGSLVCAVTISGVPEPRSCVLLRWLDGRVREIHAAAEQLAGESLRWTSVKAALATGTSGASPRFNRMRHGEYQSAR